MSIIKGNHKMKLINNIESHQFIWTDFSKQGYESKESREEEKGGLLWRQPRQKMPI